MRQPHAIKPAGTVTVNFQAAAGSWCSTGGQWSVCWLLSDDWEVNLICMHFWEPSIHTTEKSFNSQRRLFLYTTNAYPDPEPKTYPSFNYNPELIVPSHQHQFVLSSQFSELLLLTSNRPLQKTHWFLAILHGAPYLCNFVIRPKSPQGSFPEM